MTTQLALPTRCWRFRIGSFYNKCSECSGPILI